MNEKFLLQLSMIVAGLLMAGTLYAQSSEFPRTEYGSPNLQGIYTYRTLTPLNRPRELEHLEVLTAEQAAEWEDFENRRQNRDLIIDSVGGAGYPPGVISYNNFWYERGVKTISDRRTSLVYDPPNGRMPSLNAAGRERARARGENRRLSTGPEARTLADRCLMSGGAGPPLVPGAYNNNIQIVQTEDHVMILSEMIHRARIIRFDEEHQTRHIKWDGDSIARWDGDTLVISTQHFYYHDNGRGTSKQMKLEERFRRVNSETLEYDFTIEDPLSWDRSWSAKFPMRHIEDPIYEYACHEGNHGLPGILAGWRRYESMGMNGNGTPKE
ncbi:MAG: hypothetical protein CMQ32_04365 [Gammaproteobacteria bacterium]|nr:hypothetical protein [Gammaproteobacteria bacterium]MBE47051.1 hypothetical protein [Gammaproteobacteria bacterium]MCH2344669.1 hypothetical protein [Pseudomonadales bacterium]HAC87751.1 hypothetical protein [Gammaproteobacteria bacterium]HAD72100.1 hypothetical protein [Gammaproteobacteria bacterium]